MRVLIAEDDLTSRSILTAIVKKMGYDPVVTKNGASAWDVLKQPGAPNLVLLDWNMPAIDGLEVIRRLRNIDSSNPPYVILLTGRREKGDIVQGLKAKENLYERKRAQVANAGIPTKPGTISITISLGVATGTGESTVESMLTAADSALYQAKADGRNRVAYAL